jgi:hypothetical protein
MLLRFFQAQAQASYVAGFPVPLPLPPGPTVDVTVLGLVGGAPGGETPRVADSSAAGAGRFFHNKRTSTMGGKHGVGTRVLLGRRFMSGFGVLEAFARATQQVHRHQHRPGGRGTPP